MEYTVSLMRQVLQKYERQGRVTKDLLSPILASDEKLTDYFKEIPKLNEKIRSLKQSGKDKYALEEVRIEKTELKEKYGECIDRFVQLSLDKLHDKDFQLNLKKVVCRGKDAFQVEPSLENMLFMGMLNRNLRSCYKVQPANRIPILRVLKSLLEENHDMIILRLDIKSFFESISFDDILTKFTDDGILCPESFKLLSQIKEAYKKQTDANVGIPRGIPCSSFLAEIYMRDIDSRIKSMPGVYYYQRYVDDMIILICPENDHISPKQYFKLISNMVSKYGLKLHALGEQGKTKLIDTRKSEYLMFSYLGYSIRKSNGNVHFSLSHDKYNHYEEWIHKSFKDFKYEIKNGRKGALTKLLHQLRLMTSNYHLTGNKHQVISGIYFKYPFLTTTSSLKALDDLLQDELSHLTIEDVPLCMGHFANKQFSRQDTLEYIVKRCSKYSFVKGYKEVRTSNISTANFRRYKN